LSKINTNGSITNPFQNYIAKSKYARWLEKEGRRETWSESVDRYMTFMLKHLKDEYSYVPAKEMSDRIHDAVLNLEVMPSMRAIMTAGPAAEREPLSTYNCSFAVADSPRVFDEAMYILMNGTGLGFSVENQHVSKLPTIADELYPTNTTLVIEDSKTGWAKGLKELVSLLYSGQIPTWDMSKVRPAGARLKTFGGRASGPAPLIEVFEFFVTKFKGAAGRKLTSLEVHDLLCKIAEIVVVGGVRRSALISLSDLGDRDMAQSKSGTFYNTDKQRFLANNSAIYQNKPSLGSFMHEWTNLYESHSGERGIFNLDGARKHTDKFGRRDSSQIMGTNPCLTGDTMIATVNGPVSFAELAETEDDVQVYSWHPKTKEPVVRWMRRPHMTAKNVPILEIEFDSGLIVKATPDHGFYSFRGKRIEARDLTVGMSVRAWSMSKHRDGHLRVHAWDAKKNSANHQWVHRMIWENEIGPIPEGMVIDHIDGNPENNVIENFQLLTPAEHNSKHYADRYANGFDGTCKNHKVIGIRESGTADVYNGMVEDSHTYIIVDPTAVAGIQSGIVSANCGEILLRSAGLCNLTEVVVRPEDTEDSVRDKIQLAAVLGTWQSSLTKFKYLRKVWQRNAEEERLLGVSLTGVYDNALFNGSQGHSLLADSLKFLREQAVLANKIEAGKLGINASVAVTTQKPSGTVSQLVDCASGGHPRFARHYIRTVRGANMDPLTQFLKDCGVPSEPDFANPERSTVFSFPIYAGKDTVTRNEVTALEHLEIWKIYKENWTEHNPSVTIQVAETEWFSVADWVYKNFDAVTGIAFLDRDDHVYQQAPYQDITEKQYNDLVAKMPDLNWALLSAYESTDEALKGSQELACSAAGGCEVIDITVTEGVMQ
jgi:ribonucleotide reductase alpha subunit